MYALKKILTIRKSLISILCRKKIYVKNLNELSAITNIKKANQAFRSREGKKIADRIVFGRRGLEKMCFVLCLCMQF